MSEIKRCLFCYKPLSEAESFYHGVCSKKFFGKTKAPQLPYKLDELDALAKKIVQQSATVTGVQAKLSLHLAPRGNEAGRLTLVGLWGNYILKPPIDRYPWMPEIEDLTMHLASYFKIDTVPHSLIPLQSGELAYITRRIDRTKKEHKFHMEDMCQLTERLTEDKYKGSMEQVAKAIRKYSSNPGLDIIRFYEVTLFSFLTGNADMHLKNFSLFYDGNDMIHLAPAYDMLSTRMLIAEKDDSEELALTLNGKKSRFNRADFVKFAETTVLNEKQVQNVFKRFQDGLKGALFFIGDSFLPENKKEEYKQLIISRAERLNFGVPVHD